MTDRPRELVAGFLATDPDDVGCDVTMEVLDAYAESLLAGTDLERDYPGVTAHLRSCPPCGQDLDGLLALISAQPGPPRRTLRSLLPRAKRDRG